MKNRLAAATRALFVAVLLSLALAPTAHADNGIMEAAQFLMIGPVLLLVTVGAFVVLCLFALGLNRATMLADFVPRAVLNARRGRPLHFLWGLLCFIFVATASAISFSTQILFLLGALLLCAAALLLGCGVVVSAASLGYRILALFGNEPEDTLAAARAGLPLLFFVAAVPFIGWLQAIIAAAMGVGAVLEVLARRD